MEGEGAATAVGGRAILVGRFFIQALTRLALFGEASWVPDVQRGRRDAGPAQNVLLARK
jgi:hypothetical protein